MQIIKKTLTTITSGAMLLACLAGCSRQERPPLELIGAAKMAVHTAEQNDHTTRFAPAELQNAQQKVINAEEALNRDENRMARRLSEQAIVDAQLASARTLTAQTRAGANEVRSALSDVQTQVQRNR